MHAYRQMKYPQTPWTTHYSSGMIHIDSQTDRQISTNMLPHTFTNILTHVPPPHSHNTHTHMRAHTHTHTHTHTQLQTQKHIYVCMVFTHIKAHTHRHKTHLLFLPNAQKSYICINAQIHTHAHKKQKFICTLSETKH